MRHRGSNRKSKRGQVTLFVIMAILLVLVIAGVFWYKKSAGEEDQKIKEETAGIVSEQSQVLGSAVGECLERLTASGVELIGLQGGYIYTAEDIDKGVFKNDEGKEVVLAGNVLDTENNRRGYNEVPYWMTKDSIAIPSKEFMEEELEDYLEINLPVCVDSFRGLREKGMEVDSEGVSADVSFADFVYVKLSWPINAKDQGNNTFVFEETEYKHPVDLQKIYNIAFTLASNELTHNYLEEHAKQLISLYSYAGGKKNEFNLPPLSLTVANQDCDSVSWTKSEVKDSLTAIFYRNYPHLRVAQTNFTKAETGNPASQGVYDSFILDYFEPMPNVSIDFRYAAENDLYFDISPSSGDTITPERISQTGIPFLPSFCNLEYRYKYSLQIPILVKIKDTDSLKHEGGFEFYFPMMASICGNQNRACVGAPDYRTNVSLNKLFGEDVESKLYNCTDAEKSLNISIKLPDSSAVFGADVTHTCSGYINECYLGKTGSDGMLKTNIPKCVSPTLAIQKQGYALIKDRPRESYQLEEIENYSVDMELVKASTFLKNYYLSSGFTSVHPKCVDTYGTAQDLLRQTRSPLRKQDDRVTLTLGGDYLQTPIIIYPVQDSLKLNSGRFNVTTSYSSKVVIYPSEYEHDDDELVVSLNPSRNGDYKGIWFLGKNEFNWNLNKSFIFGDRIKFYAMVEHFSDDTLYVKSLQNPVVQPDGRLSARVKADKDCDGLNEAVDLDLKPADYIKFITPEFS